MSTPRRSKRPRTSKRRPVTRSGGSSERLDSARGVFMISVAAELADMHPQTLRMYEARGLITPQRSPGKTRLYSQRDVERLRRIQQMTDEGLNLAGVETVLDMEMQVKRLRDELKRMRRRAAEAEQRMLDEIERVRRTLRTELVPYGAYEPGELIRGEAPADSVKIPVERRRRSRSGGDGG